MMYLHEDLTRRPLEEKSGERALGITFAVGVDQRMDMAAKVGSHRTSMLQDVELGG